MRVPYRSPRSPRYRRDVSDDEKPAASKDYDLPPWAERVLDICLSVFFVTVMGATTTLIVVGTIVVSRALL